MQNAVGDHFQLNETTINKGGKKILEQSKFLSWYSAHTKMNCDYASETWRTQLDLKKTESRTIKYVINWILCKSGITITWVMNPDK